MQRMGSALPPLTLSRAGVESPSQERFKRREAGAFGDMVNDGPTSHGLMVGLDLSGLFQPSVAVQLCVWTVQGAPGLCSAAVTSPLPCHPLSPAEQPLVAFPEPQLWLCQQQPAVTHRRPQDLTPM